MTLYFVAGEISGDNHGAALMAALKKLDDDFRFIGRGGPQMRLLAGEGFHNWVEQAAVLGLWEVLKKYGYFREQVSEALHAIGQSKPDAVVLIDYPGFNLRLAHRLRRQSPRQKIIYYISPQVWAWNRGRIKKMARYLDLMLCIFPFEADLYNRSGLRTEFVGHPMIDRLRPLKISSGRDPDLIGLFPGSRVREVRKILPIMMAAANEMVKSKPNLRFEVAAASSDLALQIREMLSNEQIFRITTGQTAHLMQKACAGIVASGSATLEAAYFRMPFVLVYKVAWLTYLAARMVVSVDYLGMPNVLANKIIVPEFIQHQARPSAIARAVLRLLENCVGREQMISEFDQVITQLGEGGASERAARSILSELACHSERSEA